MRATMNGTGFMFTVLDDFAREFIDYAATLDEPVLELGCAYGVATLPALAKGATVVASDLSQQHLDILLDEAPPRDRDRLTCVQAELPGAEFPAGHFGAILCSRVLHFLDGAAVDASVKKMFQWLRPGGKLFLVADTPYGIWRKFAPVFEARLARGDRWPGIMVALENYLPQGPTGRPVKGPPFMNLMAPELLARCAQEAGFETVRAEYIDRSDFSGLGRMDGRENTGLVALKPR